jgi:arylsulfatase A-like enzyme
MASVPVVTVSGTSRPVLDLPVFCAAPVFVIAAASRTGMFRVEVPVPEALRSGPLHVLPRVLALRRSIPARLRTGEILDLEQVAEVTRTAVEPGSAIILLAPMHVPTPGARERITLDVGPAGRGNALVFLLVCPETKHRHDTGSVVVPRGARLRFGFGVRRVGAERAAARFTVTAQREGRTERLFRERFTRSPADWEEREVDLERFAGQTIRLRFTREVKPEADGTVPPLTWGDPTITTPAPRAPAPFNVLLVSLDTLRADRLGCYGYERPTSPAIDHELAARGTVFMRAFTAFPSTAGGHATLLTSLDPCAHGFVDAAAPPALRPDAPTLAERLRAHGYETAAFTEGGWLVPRLGFARGFGSFVERSPFDPDPSTPAGGAAATFGEALRWIEGHRNEPWFVFAHTYQVHHPYSPPPGYVERVTQRPADDTASESDRYDAEILYTDSVVGELLMGLERLSLTERTLVVVVSDHGEYFSGQVSGGHGNTLFDSVLRVPLVMRAPGLVPARRRIDAVVGLVDVVPTVLDLLGLPPPSQVHGRSLAPLLRGERLPERTLYAELTRFGSQGRPHMAARQGDIKWVIDLEAGVGLAYDVVKDPDELNNLSPAMPADVPGRMLVAFHQHCAIRGPSHPSSPPLDATERGHLRALGYAE